MERVTKLTLIKDHLEKLQDKPSDPSEFSSHLDAKYSLDVIQKEQFPPNSMMAFQSHAKPSGKPS